MRTRAGDPAGAKGSERWVKDGLRALREQAPSDESRRATLARLGLSPERLAPGRRGDPPAVVLPATRAVRGALRWWLGGILLGIVIVIVRHWLPR